MLKRLLLILFIIVSCAPSLWAHAWGVVLDDEGQPLVGANVYWANTTVGTTTDSLGTFELEPVATTHLLVTSFMGFHSDTTSVHTHKALTIVLVSDLVLDEVTINARKMAIIKSRVATMDVETIDASKICNAACCNLAGSFETSASVDVSYADAATGAQQIRLLGLEGTYVQLNLENSPGVRGLNQTFGLDFLPGSWLQSIQVSKGTSSVINGYESTAGQINVELLKPQTANPIDISAALGESIKPEVSITGGWQVNRYASTALLAHYEDRAYEDDGNKDGFLDGPKMRDLNLLNRWNWVKGDYTGQILVHGVYDRRWGGTTTKRNIAAPNDSYLIDLKTHRVDGFFKQGYIIDDELNRSIGLVLAASYHDLDNQYGPSRSWKANQTNVNLNLIFQTSFEDGPTDPMDCQEHQLSTGISTNYDRYREQLSGVLAPMTTLDNLQRDEVTPGVFAEYTYSYQDKFSLQAGARFDWSNLYGLFITPRINLRYAPFEWWVMRASAGLGYRSPNIITDHVGYLPSNRQWVTVGPIQQEKAVNTGATTSFYIPIANRELRISAEYYYTRFLDAMLTDLDADAHAVRILNMREINGQSFSHSAQIEASMEILSGWLMTAAFRYTDVKQTSFNPAEGTYQLRDKALQHKFKGLITTSYTTPKQGWRFDVTAQFNGPTRMPDGFIVPEGSKQYTEKHGNLYATWFPQLSAQITKNFHHASIYVGTTNMTNFSQDNPIVSVEHPSSPSFDASMVWGPISGWDFYVGFTWGLDKEEEEHHHH